MEREEKKNTQIMAPNKRNTRCWKGCNDDKKRNIGWKKKKTNKEYVKEYIYWIQMMNGALQYKRKA